MTQGAELRPEDGVGDDGVVDDPGYPPSPHLDRIYAEVKERLVLQRTELDDLRSVIFAVTRSLQEAQQAVRRSDGTTVWGVGCHPGVARAQKEFSPDHFADIVESTAFVGEVGLDGKSRVPMTKQRDTFRAALEVLTLGGTSGGCSEAST